MHGTSALHGACQHVLGVSRSLPTHTSTHERLQHEQCPVGLSCVHGKRPLPAGLAAMVFSWHVMVRLHHRHGPCHLG